MEKYKFTNGQANLLIAIFKHLRQYSEQAKANGTSVADELNNATTQDFDMYAILLDDALANCLTNHEHELIARRYGLQPYTKCFTREEVARNFNVTYERIRQCEARSIQKIRRFMTELNDEETDKVICDLQPDVQKQLMNATRAYIAGNSTSEKVYDHHWTVGLNAINKLKIQQEMRKCREAYEQF